MFDFSGFVKNLFVEKSQNDFFTKCVKIIQNTQSITTCKSKKKYVVTYKLDDGYLDFDTKNQQIIRYNKNKQQIQSMDCADAGNEMFTKILNIAKKRLETAMDMEKLSKIENYINSTKSISRKPQTWMYTLDTVCIDFRTLRDEIVVLSHHGQIMYSVKCAWEKNNPTQEAKYDCFNHLSTLARKKALELSGKNR
ncbi:MAG: hypothetical protein MJ164_03560 [Alphaproteobacteria bacterium]|nr:hypothetical protein [Alphaproteobacteria bacterium]